MKKVILSLITLAALAASGLAAAQQQQSQGYVGLQVGSARTDVDCSGASSCKNHDTGVKVYGGYKLTPQWALELGYTDFGKVEGTDSGVSLTWKTTSIGLGAAYWAQFNNDWSGVARLGIASNEAKVSLSGAASGSDTQRKTKPYVGLGVGYALNKQTTLTGNWDWTESEISGNGVSVKIKHNLYSVGVNYAF